MLIKAPALTWTYLFERALVEEIGIAFVISGIRRDYFVTELGKCRKQSGDPRYNDLVIFQPVAPCEDQIWICKKMVELDAGA